MKGRSGQGGVGKRRARTKRKARGQGIDKQEVQESGGEE
jgi:hypothetical protein